MIKYVKTFTGEFILFPDNIQHLDMAMGTNLRVVSAGFVTTLHGELHCIGESTSLKMGVLPQDTDELREWLGVDSTAVQKDVLEGVVDYMVDELGCDHIAGMVATRMPRKY